MEFPPVPLSESTHQKSSPHPHQGPPPPTPLLPHRHTPGIAWGIRTFRTTPKCSSVLCRPPRPHDPSMCQ
eukprot:4068030-Ditylum_brightwellii.AAC.1